MRRIAPLTAAALTGAAGVALTLGAVLPAVADTTTDDDATQESQSLTDRLTRIKEALAGLVSDGTLTQEEADTVAETLNSSDVLGHGGHGMRGMGGVSLDAAAEALGLETDELRTMLEDGSTLSEVAAAQGVDTAALVDALVAAATERIDQAVTDGDLDQARADELKADLESRITAMVEEGMPMRGGPGGPGGHGGRGGPMGGMSGDGSTSDDDASGSDDASTPSTTPSLES